MTIKNTDLGTLEAFPGSSPCGLGNKRSFKLLRQFLAVPSSECHTPAPPQDTNLMTTQIQQQQDSAVDGRIDCGMGMAGENLEKRDEGFIG
ncbi:hypothetical protein Nepgr_005820 [Nepenthes gracilis]|uniref:Uncharacterized protein n=1 Tax=Nepenthes gracilis TaxID=150966 RepID=A0AAD3S4B3_NEPGR|nr:hypothetical protein Nepgr_005820 [Nepenthes gracilis]